LAAELSEKDDWRSRYALEALGGMGTGAAPAIPEIVPLLASEDFNVSSAAIEALAATGDRERALPALRAYVPRNAFSWRRWQVVAAVRSFGPENADVLLGPLQDGLFEEWRGRRGGPCVGSIDAARDLGALGEAAAPAVPALLRALAPPSTIRDAAADALAKIGAPALDPLRDALLTSDVPEVRAGAVRALGKMADRGFDVLPSLRQALGDPDVVVRGTAAAAILHVVPSDGAAADVFTAALAAAESAAQIEWLVALGPAQTVALPAVRRAQAGPVTWVRLQAFAAESRITGDPHALVGEVIALLDAGSCFAGDGLHLVHDAGADGAPLVAAIARAIDRDARVPDSATSVLVALGPAADGAVPVLTRVVERDGYSTEQACRALAAIGSAAAAAVPALTARLARTCRDPEIHLIRALGAIGPAAAPAAPQIRLRLASYDAATVDAAREALDRIESR
jgi:HEAT repeat protein